MKAVTGWLIQIATPFAEIIGVAIDSDGSNWRKNQTRDIPGRTGGTCDMASSTVGPDLQQMNGLKAWPAPLVTVSRPAPTNSGLSSRILGAICVTIVNGLFVRSQTVNGDAIFQPTELNFLTLQTSAALLL